MSEDDTRFSAQEFGALLTLTMVSDPWPASKRNCERIVRMLNAEAKARDYNDWVHAYHELCGDIE